MARLTIRLLGSLQVAVNGQPVTVFESDKVRALLAYLAVERDQPHRRERLAGLLWPEMPEGSARNNLRVALSNLRKAIGDKSPAPFLRANRQTIQLNPEADVWIDVLAFSELLAVKGRPRPMIELLQEAVCSLRVAVQQRPECSMVLRAAPFHRVGGQGERCTTETDEWNDPLQLRAQHADRLGDLRWGAVRVQLVKTLQVGL